MQKNIQLRNYNTFAIEAIAAAYAEFGDEQSLIEILDDCRAQGLPWRVLGAGSNVLLEGDFSGAILRSSARSIVEAGGLVVADAGVVWDDFVRWCVAHDLGGVENLAYIPGTVGAAPIQNIGAYGAEAADTIVWVEYLDTETETTVKILNKDCQFGYRDSIFKRHLFGKSIILRVAFSLTHYPTKFNIEYGDVEELVEQLGGTSLENIYNAITQIRKNKLPEPSQFGNAGSFFKNPVVDAKKFNQIALKFPDIRYFELPDGMRKIPAAWLIENVGWKGCRIGPAGVHERQPLVIINLGGAKGADIITLAEKIIEDVETKFNITLEMEVNRI